ncbi:MAG: hypothetical protein J5I81_05370 [Nitrococcus mobilis]|nr:hypothetical protein [Nitrococcus mobilis]
MIEEAYECNGVIDLTRHDTAPGARGPLAPPENWNGSDEDYLRLLRSRYRRAPGAHQHLALTARIHACSFGEGVSVTGPYRAPALQALDALVRQHGAPLVQGAQAPVPDNEPA